MGVRVLVPGLVAAVLLMAGCGAAATGTNMVHVAGSTGVSSTSGQSTKDGTAAQVGAGVSVSAATAKAANTAWIELNALVQGVH